MIIDIHTHAFPVKIAASALHSMQGNCHTALFSDGTAEGLLASEQQAGVDLAIIQPVATNPEKVSHLNDAALEINKGFQGSGIFSFGAMHPLCAYWEKELERIKATGLIGIKLHPAYERVAIDSPQTIAILKKCKDLDLIVLIHSGYDVGIPGATEALPEKTRRALDAVGPLKFIAAHMGGWRQWKETVDLLSKTGIYIDTAFSLGTISPAGDEYPWTRDELQMLREEEFCAIIESFGADHVLFGTDNPWADPASELSKLRKLPLSAENLNLILGENARNLLLSSGMCL